ncbi:MAG: hypothetical protein MJK10_20700 [Pseudomonadales bacterium]|nr:hypothetical protein [Pseudomonadales bacterium]NRA18714.1 hypothetical protein [Oceanospirillaceae bacterium]
MSQILTGILDDIRTEYVQILQHSSGLDPFLNAQKLCQNQLSISTDQLAKIINEDPNLLAARAGELIRDLQQAENPSAGHIISANIRSAALESLLDAAVHYGWLQTNAEGAIQIGDGEIEAADALLQVSEDYSQSKTALENISKPGVSVLNTLIHGAETEFIKQLDSQVLDAYSLAIEVAGAHSVFTPEEIAPLVIENPLLLGLRADDLVVDDVFESDPPAGIIISSHITQMVIDHLLELATDRGALALDGEGQLILPGNEDQPPLIH